LCSRCCCWWVDRVTRFLWCCPLASCSSAVADMAWSCCSAPTRSHSHGWLWLTRLAKALFQPSQTLLVRSLPANVVSWNVNNRATIGLLWHEIARNVRIILRITVSVDLHIAPCWTFTHFTSHGSHVISLFAHSPLIHSSETIFLKIILKNLYVTPVVTGEFLKSKQFSHDL
jgi:hypothetical protein